MHLECESPNGALSFEWTVSNIDQLIELFYFLERAITFPCRLKLFTDKLECFKDLNDFQSSNQHHDVSS